MSCLLLSWGPCSVSLLAPKQANKLTFLTNKKRLQRRVLQYQTSYLHHSTLDLAVRFIAWVHWAEMSKRTKLGAVLEKLRGRVGTLCFKLDTSILDPGHCRALCNDGVSASICCKRHIKNTVYIYISFLSLAPSLAAEDIFLLNCWYQQDHEMTSHQHHNFLLELLHCTDISILQCTDISTKISSIVITVNWHQHFI